MQRLEVSGVVRPLYESLGVKGLKTEENHEAIRNTLKVKCGSNSASPEPFNRINL